ncbi:MAG: STAS domain-containing protein [Actinomycetota bacterium]|nr:STAS domain-containing protein [Actinomycetota bacterium]
MQRDRDARFSYSVSPLAGSAVRIQLLGEVDLEVEDRVRAALGEAADAAEDSLVVDLSGLTFLDSTGLRLLIELRERLDGGSPVLSLVPGNASVQRVFEVTGVDRSFNFMMAYGSKNEGPTQAPNTPVDAQD